MRCGQQVGASCHDSNAEQWEGLCGSLKMPLGTVEETSVGLPFKAAQSVSPKFSFKSLHVNLSLLQSGGLMGRRVCVCMVGGFRPLVLGCLGTHSHMCGESLGSFC